MLRRLVPFRGITVMADAKAERSYRGRCSTATLFPGRPDLRIDPFMGHPVGSLFPRPTLKSRDGSDGSSLPKSHQRLLDVRLADRGQDGEGTPVAGDDHLLLSRQVLPDFRGLSPQFAHAQEFHIVSSLV